MGFIGERRKWQTLSGGLWLNEPSSLLCLLLVVASAIELGQKKLAERGSPGQSKEKWYMNFELRGDWGIP